MNGDNYIDPGKGVEFLSWPIEYEYTNKNGQKVKVKSIASLGTATTLPLWWKGVKHGLMMESESDETWVVIKMPYEIKIKRPDGTVKTEDRLKMTREYFNHFCKII